MKLDTSRVHTPTGLQEDKVYTMISIDITGKIEIIHEDVKYVSHEDKSKFKTEDFRPLDRLFMFSCKPANNVAGFGMYLNHPTEGTMLILQEKNTVKKLK